MPRKSIDTVTEQLSSCARDLLEVSRDPEWSGQNNVLTRSAVPVFMRRAAESARWVVVVRFVLHDYELLLNASVKRAVNFRDPSVLLRARWAINEALFVLADDPEGFFGQLRPILKNEGLNASLGYIKYSGNITQDHDRCELTFRLFEKG